MPEEKKPLKTPAARVLVVAPRETLDRLAEVATDVCAAGLITALDQQEGAFRVDVELGELPPPAQGSAS